MNMNNHRYLAKCINDRLEEYKYDKIHIKIVSLKEIYVSAYYENKGIDKTYCVTTLNASLKLIDKLIKEIYQQ